MGITGRHWLCLSPDTMSRPDLFFIPTAYPSVMSVLFKPFKHLTAANSGSLVCRCFLQPAFSCGCCSGCGDSSARPKRAATGITVLPPSTTAVLYNSSHPSRRSRANDKTCLMAHALIFAEALLPTAQSQGSVAAAVAGDGDRQRWRIPQPWL